jgi:hypothetical protein
VNEDVVQNIRSRIERCRRLAAMITDKRAIEILLQMAKEGEKDIKRLAARDEGEDESAPAD